MDITITGTPAIIEDFDAYPSKAQKVIVRALNRGIVAARTQIVRDVARDSGLKSGAVKNAISERKATLGSPKARLGAGLARIPLIQFGARGPEPSRGRGRVTYRIGTAPRRGGEGFFIATMKSGHRGVFKRAGRPSKSDPKREAITEKFGPSLGRVFAKYRAAALARGADMFMTTLDRELDYQKGKA